MSEADLNKFSVEELQAALEAKKAEVKDTKAEQQDWSKMSLEEVHTFVVNQALAKGKENPEFSDEFVKEYRKIQIDKQLERQEKEAAKNALIKSASMEEVYNWLSKHVFNVPDELLNDIVFEKCPYRLTQFCDVKDTGFGEIKHFSFAVAHNGHAFVAEGTSTGNEAFFEKYI